MSWAGLARFVRFGFYPILAAGFLLTGLAGLSSNHKVYFCRVELTCSDLGKAKRVSPANRATLARVISQSAPYTIASLFACARRCILIIEEAPLKIDRLCIPIISLTTTSAASILETQHRVSWQMFVSALTLEMNHFFSISLFSRTPRAQVARSSVPSLREIS